MENSRLNEQETNGVDKIWYVFFDLPREHGIVLTFNDYLNSFSNCSI